MWYKIEYFAACAKSTVCKNRAETIQFITDRPTHGQTTCKFIKITYRKCIFSIIISGPGALRVH
jgi:hypothetical protein